MLVLVLDLVVLDLLVVLDDRLGDALEGVVLWSQDGDVRELIATLSYGGDDLAEEVVYLCLELVLCATLISLLPLMYEDPTYFILVWLGNLLMYFCGSVDLLD